MQGIRITAPVHCARYFTERQDVPKQTAVGEIDIATVDSQGAGIS